MTHLSKISALVLTLAIASSVAFANYGEDLGRWSTGSHRRPANVERNVYRHPVETLTFFGVTPSLAVVEIWPSGGWYTEILAPFLKGKGKYYAAGFALTANRTPKWRKDLQRRFDKKLAERPELYDEVIVTELSIPERTAMAPAGSADMVLTFRNVHNWMAGDYAQAMFDAMYKALKPGGVLGVVEHRAKPGTTVDAMIKSGYVTEAYVKEVAKRAGFEFVAASEVNANPKDTADHPAGVWTLPPSLRLGERDRDDYLAIGESDRMTLKFRKPTKRRRRK